MSGNGCSCDGSPAPAAPSAAATPCGSGAQHTEVVWDTLSLRPSSTEVSRVIPTGGANAIDVIILTIFGQAAIQTAFVAQVSEDGVNFRSIGAAGQSTAVGYTLMGPITGNGSRYFRLVAIEQAAAGLALYTVVVRFTCF